MTEISLDSMASPEGLIQHIQTKIGPIAKSYGELVSDDLTIGIHHIRSTIFRRYEIVVTSGMSAKPMTVPEDSKGSRYAEILAILPKGWRLSPESLGDEKAYWPIRLLKSLARFPHHNNTWLGFGHTMANGSSEQDTKAYAPDTDLCAVILLPSMTLGEAAWSYKRKSGDSVFLWCAVPLYMSELKFKMTNGADALMDAFDRAGVNDRIDPRRRSAV